MAVCSFGLVQEKVALLLFRISCLCSFVIIVVLLLLQSVLYMQRRPTKGTGSFREIITFELFLGHNPAS